MPIEPAPGHITNVDPDMIFCFKVKHTASYLLVDKILGRDWTSALFILKLVIIRERLRETYLPVAGDKTPNFEF